MAEKQVEEKQPEQASFKELLIHPVIAQLKQQLQHVEVSFLVDEDPTKANLTPLTKYFNLPAKFNIYQRLLVGEYETDVATKPKLVSLQEIHFAHQGFGAMMLSVYRDDHGYGPSSPHLTTQWHMYRLEIQRPVGKPPLPPIYIWESLEMMNPIMRFCIFTQGNLVVTLLYNKRADDALAAAELLQAAGGAFTPIQVEVPKLD